MNEFYAEIKQVGTELTIIKDCLPAQFSENVPIKIDRDPNYSDYDAKVYFATSESEMEIFTCNEGCPLHLLDSGIVILPREAFAGGYLFISLSLCNGDEVIYTNYVKFKVRKSFNGDMILSEVSWERLAAEFLESYVKEKADQIESENIQEAVNNYLEANPVQVQPGATTEQVEQIQKNAENISQLYEEIADSIKTKSTAEVGQTIVVKTVDETGKPIEFEMESVADEMDALVSLSECGIIIPAYQDGTFYTDADGAIYIL